MLYERPTINVLCQKLVSGRRFPARYPSPRVRKLRERRDKTYVHFISTFVSVRFVPTNINWTRRETSQVNVK